MNLDKSVKSICPNLDEFVELPEVKPETKPLRVLSPKSGQEITSPLNETYKEGEILENVKSDVSDISDVPPINPNATFQMEKYKNIGEKIKSSIAEKKTVPKFPPKKKKMFPKKTGPKIQPKKTPISTKLIPEPIDESIDESIEKESTGISKILKKGKEPTEKGSVLDFLPNKSPTKSPKKRTLGKVSPKKRTLGIVKGSPVKGLPVKVLDLEMVKSGRKLGEEQPKQKSGLSKVPRSILSGVPTQGLKVVSPLRKQASPKTQPFIRQASIKNIGGLPVSDDVEDVEEPKSPKLPKSPKKTKKPTTTKTKKTKKPEKSKDALPKDFNIDRVSNDRTITIKGEKIKSYTVPDLKKFANIFGLEYTSKSKKSDLVDLIQDSYKPSKTGSIEESIKDSIEESIEDSIEESIEERKKKSPKKSKKSPKKSTKVSKKTKKTPKKKEIGVESLPEDFDINRVSEKRTVTVMGEKVKTYTVSELKNFADILGVKYTSKMKKSELVIIVEDAMNGSKEKAEVEEVEKEEIVEKEQGEDVEDVVDVEDVEQGEDVVEEEEEGEMEEGEVGEGVVDIDGEKIVTKLISTKRNVDGESSYTVKRLKEIANGLSLKYDKKIKKAELVNIIRGELNLEEEE